MSDSPKPAIPTSAPNKVAPDAAKTGAAQPDAKAKKKKLTDEEIEQQLYKRYESFDEKKLYELMARKLVMISKEERKTRLITESIKNSTEQLAQYYKILLGLLIGSIAIFVVYVLYKILSVYISYHSFISWVNSAQGGVTTWPAGGLGTALSLEYPVMASWFGFTDPYLPMAAFFSWQQYGTTTISIGGTVNDNATYVLKGMYEFAALGGQPNNPDCGVVSGDDIPVYEILCCGWGNAQEVDPCANEYCDTTLTTSDYVNAGTAAITGGTQGGMMAHMMSSSKSATASGTILLAVVQAGLSLWQSKMQMQAYADANGCG